MSRVPSIDPERFAPELADAVGHPTNGERVQLGALPVWANLPTVAVAFLEFQRAQAAASTLSPRLRELVRLRVAWHNQCRGCMAVRSAAAVAGGMDDAAVCSLERPEDAPDLTASERAALHYADLFATDHLAVNDETFAALREHFDDRQIVELGVHIGTCVGFGRLAMTWDYVDHLPEEFRDRSAPAAPWFGGTVVR